MSAIQLRTSRPGTDLDLLVLSAGAEGLIGVDLASGAFVRVELPRGVPREGRPPGVDERAGAARWSGAERGGPEPVVEEPLVEEPLVEEVAIEEVAIEEVAEPLELVRVTGVVEPPVVDPARPEAVVAARAPERLGAAPRRRRVRRILDDLVVREGELLGFPGPACSYWALDGSSGSVALVEGGREVLLVRGRDRGEWRARFRVGSGVHDLPIVDRPVLQLLTGARRGQLSGTAVAKTIGYLPAYLVVALSAPRHGYCYKVVTALLPRP